MFCAGIAGGWENGDSAMEEHKNLFPKCVYVQGLVNSTMDDESFIVEKLLRKRILRKKVQFLVKWAGYEKTSWEPVANIHPDLIEVFENENVSTSTSGTTGSQLKNFRFDRKSVAEDEDDDLDNNESVSSSPFGDFLNNPGLQHLTENIFRKLDIKNLKNCRLINKSCEEILTNPFFWLGKFKHRGLSLENLRDWQKTIRIAMEIGLEKYVLFYLKKCSMNPLAADIPCYMTEDFLKNSAAKIRTYLKCMYEPWVQDKIEDDIYIASTRGNVETIKIYSPLAKRPNR